MDYENVIIYLLLRFNMFKIIKTEQDKIFDWQWSSLKLFSLPFLHYSFRMMILIINFAQVPSTSMENLGFGFESELENALNWLWLYYYDYDLCHGTATMVCLFLCDFNAHMKHIVDVVYIHAILHHTLCVPQSTSTTRKIFRETLSFFYHQQLVGCWASLAPTRILLLKKHQEKK